MEYICIGKIVNTFGIRGELKIQSFSDFDDLRYRKGNTVYVLYEGQYIPFEVASFRIHKGFSMVAFKDRLNINLVEKYKDCEVYINETERTPLKEGEYYRDELEGLEVCTEEGMHVGSVVSVEETFGANNNLRILKDDGKEVLVPYVKAFIREVRIDEGKIIINNMEGLL